MIQVVITDNQEVVGKVKILRERRDTETSDYSLSIGLQTDETWHFASRALFQIPNDINLIDLVAVACAALNSGGTTRAHPAGSSDLERQERGAGPEVPGETEDSVRTD